jgi:hypothetical protein
VKIEAVIVCKDYSDFLEHTLPQNIQYLDRIVVVTHPDDKATMGLCKKFSVDCVHTTAMHIHGNDFNKGRCINIGLGHLTGHDWIMHLDADILLPHNFRNVLMRSHLKKENIYGCDRVNVRGFEHWQKHKHKTVPNYASGYFIEPPAEFPFGARIIHHEHGYTPIGFFQLWHASVGRKYPIHQGNAEHTDVLFAIQWPRENRELLPEIIVYHLESEHCEMGKNWKGRKTKPFGHHHEHHEHHHHHHKHHHHHGYKPDGDKGGKC